MMKTLILAAAFCMLAALPVRANLVENGGFEGVFVDEEFVPGAMGPWYTLGTLGTGFTIVNNNAKFGIYAAKLESTRDMLQKVSTVDGQKYILDFWAKTDGTPPSYGLVATVAGKYFVVLSTELSSDYIEYTFSFTAGSAADLTFFLQDEGAKSVYIDAVNLTPVPEPTTVIAGALLLLPFGMSTIRILRKRHIA